MGCREPCNGAYEKADVRPNNWNVRYPQDQRFQGCRFQRGHFAALRRAKVAAVYFQYFSTS
jgi:hypothetical protein